MNIAMLLHHVQQPSADCILPSLPAAAVVDGRHIHQVQVYLTAEVQDFPPILYAIATQSQTPSTIF